ncbi:MAG: hypothetical protein K0A95_00115 [Chromatiales bacterium]|nr:hypothetical protein [Gammaproteobacteria bacterium]MBW6475472.1 hypothetical protein [Chromatiales bacterium]
MASPLLIHTVEATLCVGIEEAVVEQQLGYLPWVLGENLAGQVDAWVMEQGLGYYPALDYFRSLPEAVDPALIALIDQVALFCADLSRRELRRSLQRAFSRVAVNHEQCLAYTMPRVRPSRGGAPEALARHYAPNTLKLQIQLSTVQRGEFEGAEQLALDKLRRWGGPGFSRFEILALRPLLALKA